MESILKEFLQFCEQRRSQDGQLPAALPDMAGHADEDTGTRVDSEMASSASPAVTEHQDDSSSPSAGESSCTYTAGEYLGTKSSLAKKAFCVIRYYNARMYSIHVLFLCL